MSQVIGILEHMEWYDSYKELLSEQEENIIYRATHYLKLSKEALKLVTDFPLSSCNGYFRGQATAFRLVARWTIREARGARGRARKIFNAGPPPPRSRLTIEIEDGADPQKAIDDYFAIRDDYSAGLNRFSTFKDKMRM